MRKTTEAWDYNRRIGPAELRKILVVRHPGAFLRHHQEFRHNGNDQPEAIQMGNGSYVVTAGGFADAILWKSSFGPQQEQRMLAGTGYPPRLAALAVDMAIINRHNGNGHASIDALVGESRPPRRLRIMLDSEQHRSMVDTLQQHGLPAAMEKGGLQGMAAMLYAAAQRAGLYGLRPG